MAVTLILAQTDIEMTYISGSTFLITLNPFLDQTVGYKGSGFASFRERQTK